ncbi:hypothetical protein JOM56_006023 [Amanita muscaria]
MSVNNAGEELNGPSRTARGFKSSQLTKSHLSFARRLHARRDKDSFLASETEARDITELADYPSSQSSSNTIVATPALTSYDEGELDPLLQLNGTALAGKSSAALGPQTPVPATVLFARNAAPLYLPRLDDYLAKFPSPSFPGRDKKSPQMFLPMDKLAGSGMSLDDLETNAKVLPGWRNRKNIIGVTLTILVGILGSSILSTFYSLQGLFNTVQFFALLLSTIVPVKPNDLKNNWRKVLLGTIPNVLALNFGTTLSQSISFLVVFIVIALGLLYGFYRYTRYCEQYNSIEGLQAIGNRSGQWGLVIITFLLTVIYLPLTTIAVHVLVWSQDLWVVPNPYINATSFPPTVPPLGPSNIYYDPLDFCWTTTMERNQVNWAPFLVIIALVAIATLTIWFPIELRRVITLSVPRVDHYTELGRLRKNADLDSEYQRLLQRDSNPFAFLYNAFRRGWGTYEAVYLVAKLSALLIIALIDPNNCIFRSASHSVVLIVRQVFLLVAVIAFFIVQCVYAPFMEPTNNAGEWTSRLSYILTSLIALLVTLDIPGNTILNTYVLYTIYACTYSLTVYFAVINWSITQRFVKRIAKRIDFSIDIFSPRLDISSSSIHAKRRIWQETITTLFLITSDTAIPKDQPMIYAESPHNEYSPYLLNFKGTPGERHVENLKILKEIGSVAYFKVIPLVTELKESRLLRLEQLILRRFIGPDCFWRKPDQDRSLGYARYFGNAWWIPFPPTLVLRYDDGASVVLQDIAQLEQYVVQNSSQEIQRKRQIRLALRALEGVTVQWPYLHVTSVVSHNLWPLQCCRRNRYSAGTSKQFQTCTLEVERRGHLVWNGLQLGSGFTVQLKYSKDVRVSGDVIGLDDDLDLTTPLAKFFELNQHLISSNIQRIEKALSDYRRYQRRECEQKRQVLSYRFLSFVYDQPRDLSRHGTSCIEYEQDVRVRRLMADSENILNAAHDRFVYVTRNEVLTWWYILWDDVWRRNHDTIAALERYATDFNPHYPSSIAYTPLPRPVLEGFLTQRGLQSRCDFFHAGLLNKIYLRLNEIVFGASHQAILFHIGNDSRELDMDGVDLETQGLSSSLGTGQGTDYDVPSIRLRPAYRWEGLFDDPVRSGKRQKIWLAKMGVWFGITPLWRTGLASSGLSLDVQLENGRYVVVNEK